MINLIPFPHGITVEVIDSTSPYFGRQGAAMHPMGENILVQFSEEEIELIPHYQLSPIV